MRSTADEPTTGQNTAKAGLDTTAAAAIAGGIALITEGNVTTGVVLVVIGAALFAVKRFLV